MAEKRSKWLWGFSMTLLILVAIVAITIIGIHWYVGWLAEKDMSPEEITAMERFFNEPLEIPKAWQEVEPYPEELIEAAMDLRNRWEPMDEFPQWFNSWNGPVDKLQQGRALTPEEWEEIGRIVEFYQDFLPVVAKFVNLPRYELQAFSGEDAADNLFLVVPDFVMIQRVTKLLCLQANHQAHRGEWEPAFESSLTALRLTERHPASSLIVHLIAVGCQGIAARCVGSLAAQCDEAAILRSALEEMNHLDLLINLDNLEQALLLDHIAGLRECKRRGHDVDLSSGKPGGYFFRQHLQIAQNVHCTSPDVRLPAKVASVALRVGEKMLYKIALPDTLRAHTLERTAKAKFDLARLVLVCRIAQLESGTAPQNTSQLVPEYFPVDLRDPFSETAYVWDASSELFYSIGPNERDDKNRIRYDPTNGTISTGDISLF